MRSDGSFYTPKIFADYAHTIISSHFGTDWKERYVVWDSAWGKGNLTRDYTFSRLFASTINSSDISPSVNPEATKFTFDFLNDDVLVSPIHSTLLENPRIIFFFNPPYASHSEMKNGVKLKSSFDTDTVVSHAMENLGTSRINLFSQFLYRVILIKEYYHLTDVNICVFSSTVFLSGSGYDKFRVPFLNSFNFIDGCLFNASYFDECSDRWGISFSVWKSGECTDRHVFPHSVIDVVDDQIQVIGHKDIYNVDNTRTMREWVKAPVLGKPKYQSVTLKSGLNVGDKAGSCMAEGSFGYYVNIGNSVYQSLKSCYMLTACSNTKLSGFSVDKDNFERFCVNFTARKVILNNWMNDKDEFMVPDTENELYREFLNDSVIYMLFNAHSDMTSLRNVEWMGGKYDIKNEFFCFSKNLVRLLCDDNSMDMDVDDDRFVYKYMKENSVYGFASDEAKSVMDEATRLFCKSFPYREIFDEIHPEVQIMNWDCGYYQLRLLWNEYFKDEMKKFRKTYKALANKLRPQVYELGILKG